MEHNVVRVPLGHALLIRGLGPFTIVNNHLACGGLVSTGGTQLAQTVLIENFGTAIEDSESFRLPSEAYLSYLQTDDYVASEERPKRVLRHRTVQQQSADSKAPPAGYANMHRL